MKSVSRSLKEYGRGIAGGLLFSLPLLYTMEVWWAGFRIQPLHLILYMVTTFIILLGYNRYAGMHEETTLKAIVTDSFEEMGLGLLISFLVLFMLNRINFDMDLTEISGKVIIESMLVAIGVSIGRAQLGDETENNKNSETKRNDVTAISVLSVCGCIIVAGNVAPTEEIQLIAFEITPPQLLLVVLFSLMIGSVILFFSDFRGATKAKNDYLIAKVILHTALAYSISLLVSTFILWFFGRLELNHWHINIYQVLVLGLPAMLGASAGRLLVK